MSKAGLVAAAVLAWLALASSAFASGEISDPCGTGATSPWDRAPIPVFPEPVAPWADLCGADIEGVQGTDTLRALRVRINVLGDVASGQGTGRYVLTIATRACDVRVDYRVYTAAVGSEAVETEVYGACNWHTVPCEGLEGAVASIDGRWTCATGDRFRLFDPDALSVSVSGKTVEMVLDPNRFLAGSVPRSLLEDFKPGSQVSSVIVGTAIQEGAKVTVAGMTPSFWNSSAMDRARTTSPVKLGVSPDPPGGDVPQEPDAEVEEGDVPQEPDPEVEEGDVPQEPDPEVKAGSDQQDAATEDPPAGPGPDQSGKQGTENSSTNSQRTEALAGVTGSQPARKAGRSTRCKKRKRKRGRCANAASLQRKRATARRAAQ